MTIPVFGNGEVFTEEDCETMLKTTGCDGICLGRMAAARPWVFAEWTGGRKMDAGIYSRAMKETLDLLHKYYAPVTALRKFKKIAVYQAAVFRFGHEFFKTLFRAADAKAATAAIDAFFETFPELADRPNLNLFC